MGSLFVASVGHLEAPGGAASEGPAGSVTYLEAIRAALADAMRDDDHVFLLGEDIGAFGGAFGVTAGLLARISPASAAYAWRGDPIGQGGSACRAGPHLT